MSNNYESQINHFKLQESLKKKKAIEYYSHIVTKKVKISWNHKYKEFSDNFKLDLGDWSKNSEKIDKFYIYPLGGFKNAPSI